MNLSDLLTAKKAVSETKPKETNKEKPKKEKAVKQAKTTPQEEVKEEPKEEVAKETKVEFKANEKSFKAPFRIYLAAEKRDVTHIFEDGKEYTPEEITKAMLQHGYYEFSGSVKYDYVLSENVLVPIFQQPKKG